MALKNINSPHPLIIEGFTMGEDVIEGLFYVWDADGVLTKAGTGALGAVSAQKKAKSGDPVGGIMLGCVPAKLGSGGCLITSGLAYGANGTLVIGTEGTDTIVAYPFQAGAEGDVISVCKVA